MSGLCRLLGPFHGAIAVPSVTRRRCRRRRGHRCAGGADSTASDIWWIGVRWLALANGSNIFTARRYAKRGICRRHVSVCLSVTLRYCIKTAKLRRITQIMPYDRDILVAEFLLTSASRGPSAIAELLVQMLLVTQVSDLGECPPAQVCNT